MAIEAIAWAMKQQAGGLGPKTTLILLADHVSLGTNHCWPSVTRLASIMECSRSSVFDYLGELEERGLVSRQLRRRRSDGGRSSSLYVLAFEPENPRHEDDADVDVAV